MKRKALKMPRRRASGSRAPKKIEKMTPLPMQSPSTTEVRKTISV